MSKADELFVDIAEVAKQTTTRKEPPVHPGPGTNGHAPAANGNGHANGNANGHQFYQPPVEEKPGKPEQEPAAEAAEEKKSADEEKLIEAAGATGAFLAGGLIEMIFGLANTGKHLMSFSAEEKQRLVEIDDKPETEWTVEDQSLNYKFMQRTKKYESIRDKKIPLSPKETDALKQAFAEHRRITGKDLNPNLILWTTIARIFVSRGMEIFL